jgi:hypothetical protein
MNMNQNPKGSPAGPVSGKDMADALADVLKEQGEKAKRRKETKPRGKRTTSSATWVAFVLLSALSGYLWLGSPSWLEPAPPDPISPALEDAGLRMEVFHQALLVKEFRAQEGRLPNSLSEAGDPFSEVEYHQVNGQAYRLALAGGRVAVEYASNDSLELFLGDAVQVIKEGR